MFIYYIFIICTVLLILILYYVGNSHSYIYEDYINGQWEGDTLFCEEADLSSARLFIGEPESVGYFGKQKRTCYLIMRDTDGELISNQLINIIYTPAMFANTCSPTSIGEHYIYTKIEHTDREILPEYATIKIDMKTGNLKIFADNKLHGDFYRDSEISNMAKKQTDISSISDSD